ncbi:hypothetical protein, partial [Oscillibacter sp.]|uniref:hypothetical protein n=1 Tax=Oscillibacter sp. TaxID=1945593 RepID=UPI002D806A39
FNKYLSDILVLLCLSSHNVSTIAIHIFSKYRFADFMYLSKSLLPRLKCPALRGSPEPPCSFIARIHYSGVGYIGGAGFQQDKESPRQEISA